MEWPWKQFELFKWPDPASLEELEEKLTKEKSVEKTGEPIEKPEKRELKKVKDRKEK